MSAAAGDTASIPDKLYFKIGEVARLVGVEPHVLRYWEREVKAIRPEKTRSRQRRYRRKDVALFFEVRRLLYDEKFTLAGVKKRVVVTARELDDKGHPLTAQVPQAVQAPQAAVQSTQVAQACLVQAQLAQSSQPDAVEIQIATAQASQVFLPDRMRLAAPHDEARQARGETSATQTAEPTSPVGPTKEALARIRRGLEELIALSSMSAQPSLLSRE